MLFSSLLNLILVAGGLALQGFVKEWPYPPNTFEPRPSPAENEHECTAPKTCDVNVYRVYCKHFERDELNHCKERAIAHFDRHCGKSEKWEHHTYTTGTFTIEHGKLACKVKYKQTDSGGATEVIKDFGKHVQDWNPMKQNDPKKSKKKSDEVGTSSRGEDA